MEKMLGACPPVMLFVIYMFIQILIDVLQGYYNTGVVKLIFMFAFGTVLTLLCEGGYTVVAWLTIFVPFAFMSLMVAIVLYSMKMKETTGVITEKDVDENKPPTVILPNNEMVTPVKEGCILVEKTVPPRHGMVTREYTRVYCPVF